MTTGNFVAHLSRNFNFNKKRWAYDCICPPPPSFSYVFKNLKMRFVFTQATIVACRVFGDTL